MTKITVALASILSSALLAAPLAISLGSFAAAPAFAERGGNSNNGQSQSARRGSNGQQGNQGNQGNQGHGALASELKNLNAMCANENAFANASADSNIGRIGAYRVAQTETAWADQGIIDAGDALSLNGEAFGGAASADLATAIATLESERSALNAELGGLVAGIDDARIGEIGARIAGIDAEVAALNRQLDFATADEALARRSAALDAAAMGRELSPEALAAFEAGCNR